jgi:integrase
MQSRVRELALFKLGIDSTLRGCDLVSLKVRDIVFPSRIHDSPHLGTRQYARILGGWVEELGLDPTEYGTHSMRRTKATLIYRRKKNLRAVQLLLSTPKFSRPCGISASRLTTPWKSPNRPKSD